MKILKTYLLNKKTSKRLSYIITEYLKYIALHFFQCWFLAVRVAPGPPVPFPICGQEIAGAGQTACRVHLHQIPHLPRVHAKVEAEGGGREEMDQRDHQPDWEMVEGG